MFLASVSQEFFDLCSFDKELLYNKNRRPYLIIIKLKYMKCRSNFAVPLRSNLPNYIPDKYYFSLPPRPSTRKNRIHGLHFIKMFPIKRCYLEKFNIKNNDYYNMLQNIILKNKKEIIIKAQRYLKEYQKGNIHRFSTDIERIYNKIQK